MPPNSRLNQARLRTNGVTVPLIDTMLATLAISFDVAFWTYDGHFGDIQRVGCESCIAQNLSGICPELTDERWHFHEVADALACAFVREPPRLRRSFDHLQHVVPPIDPP